MAISITLDSTNINSGNYTIKAINHESVNVSVNAMEIAREDGVKVISTNIKEKEITIDGVIKGSSISDFETNLDSFRQLINVSSGTLDIEYAGTTRRYNVVLANFSLIRDYYNVTFAKYSAKFIVPASVGEDTTVTETLSVQALTETTSSWDLSFAGSAEPRPTITYVIDTAGNLGTINLTNNTTGTQIEIGTTWANGDQVSIDTLNRQVTKNSSNVDFDGVFPRFEIGSNLISSSFSSSSGVAASNTSETSTSYVGSGTTDPARIAQSFSAPETTTYDQLDFFIEDAMAFSPYPATIDVRIETDSAGSPSGTAVTNGTVQLAASTAYEGVWTAATFATAFNLTSGTTYWIVINPDVNFSNFINVKTSNDNSYSGTCKKWISGAYVEQSNHDIWFRLYKSVSPTYSIDKKITYTKRYL